MRVLAAVPQILAERLHRAARSRFQFHNARAWDEAVNIVLDTPVEVAVLDPALEGTPRAHEIERMRVLFPSLPVLLYTHMTVAVAPVLLRLGRLGILQILLAGHDDHPRRLSDALVAEAGNAVSARLVASIGDLLAGCPGELRWAIETMIREPSAVQTVQQLADRARMDRRTCQRWFARAGLPSPSILLGALRAVYAHRLLQDPGYTVENVAAKLGYAQVRSFATTVKEVFGMPPGEMRVRLSPDDALALVRERFFKPPSADDGFANVS